MYLEQIEVGIHGMVVCDFADTKPIGDHCEVMVAILHEPQKAAAAIAAWQKTGRVVFAPDPYRPDIYVICPTHMAKIAEPTKGTDEWLFFSTITRKDGKAHLTNLMLMDHSPPEIGT